MTVFDSLRSRTKVRIAVVATTAALAGGVVLPAAAPTNASAMTARCAGVGMVLRARIISNPNEVMGVAHYNLLQYYLDNCSGR